MNKIVEIKEIIPIILEATSNNKTVLFNPSGRSMYPTIKEGIDEVVFAKVDNLKKYDICLYFNNGKYILHRIVKINKDNTYNMMGDNNTYIEHNITRGNIIAKVIKYGHNNKYITINSNRYHFIGFYRHVTLLFRKVIRKVFRDGKTS